MIQSIRHKYGWSFKCICDDMVPQGKDSKGRDIKNIMLVNHAKSDEGHLEGWI